MLPGVRSQKQSRLAPFVALGLYAQKQGLLGSFEELAPELERRGLVSREGERWFVTEAGLRIARQHVGMPTA